MSHVKSIEELFQELIELPSGEPREAFLDRVCGDDPQLRGQLERLARSHDQAGSFLADDDFLDETQVQGARIELGQSIGPYKIRELIAEGGMGSVYVAEQEKPLRRKVALKVIKPGMDSKAVLARFEAERNALALMNHPNIAKVLDAGQTDQRHPYFVMELVNGIPITEYCDEQKFTIRQRLELFGDVCQAIQHAHQKGIIHRDIKPSNVMVTELDGKPIAKVIDFGVAKALNQTLTDHSVYTSFQTVIGTPLYMSPEQASFSAVDVDTRSDVYSRGVLLYELLTGTTPFTNDDLRLAAQDEVFRYIRESEPPRPSNRISSLGKTASRVSQLRKTLPDQLGRLVQGDLDSIVMKALAKERGRRYKTADAFVGDIKRYMNDLPIEARPDSTVYRFTRMCRRNRTSVITCVLVALLTAVAFIVLYSQHTARMMTVIRLEESNAELENARELADREARTANRLLSENRELVIQQLLMNALDGDVDSVDAIIADYPDVLTDDEWPLVLRGAALWHAGRYDAAIQLLRPLVENSSDTKTAATAILSVAHIYNGDWDTGLILANRLRDVTPKEGENYDLDQLFLAYSLVFLDTERAVELLESVLERNPSWLICHAMLADAWIHLGNFSGDDELIESAFLRSKALLELTPENAFVLDVCLFAHRMKIERRQVAGVDYRDLVAPSRDLATRLQEYPGFILAHSMPAQVYDVIGDETKSRPLWENVLARGGNMWTWAAIGRLYWNSSSDEMVGKLDQRQEIGGDYSLAALAYVLADTPGGKEQAMDLFYRITRADATMSSRYNAIHIPLLLGETDVAVRSAHEWLDSYRAGEYPDTRSEWSESMLLRIVESKGEFVPEFKNRLNQVLASHMLGLLAVADGKRETALRHFEDSASKPWINIDYCWGEAFARKLRTDKNWPCENPKMQPSPP